MNEMRQQYLFTNEHLLELETIVVVIVNDVLGHFPKCSRDMHCIPVNMIQLVLYYA